MLTLALAKLNGRLGAEDETRYLAALRHLPAAVGKVLELEPQIEQWAQRFASKQHALFLGRGRHWPIAMEGALKLKEISYIHAESYAAGELKHGPLALVDKDMPVIAVAPADELLDAFEAAVARIPDVLECHLMAGTADYLLKVVARDSEDFAQIHRRHLARLPGVQTMQSSFALRTVRQTTALPI